MQNVWIGYKNQTGFVIKIYKLFFRYNPLPTKGKKIAQLS